MSGYIGPVPVPQGIQEKETFTATAGQTTFNTNGYTDGAFINVYLNGVRLINGTDYTATNGSDIVLTSAASASDVLDFETFNSFSLVDQTFDNVTLKNPTHEDTDGGRESAVSFKGEQSGGEISTLAQIQASHDGTADDQKGDLIFKTNDGSDNDAPTEAMRISSNGHVSLGSSDSTYKLFVKGTDSSDSGDVTVRLETGTVSSNSATNDLTLDLTARSKTSGGTALAHNTEIRSLADASGNGGTLAFYTDNSSAAITERMRITNAGKIGIGTTSPDTLLHLSGDDTAIIRLENSDTSLVADQLIGGLEFEKTDPSGAGAGVVGGVRMRSESSNGADAYMAFSTASSSANNTERMRIDADGDVGIGTSPSLGSTGRGLHLKGASGGPTVLKIDSTTTSQEAQVQFTVDGTDQHRIASDTNGILEFVRSGIAVHGRFVPEGAFQVSDSGSFRTWTGNITANQFIRGSQTQTTLTADSTHSAYIGSGIRSLTHRAATDAYNMIVCTTGNLSDDQFKVAGDGDVFCDGSFSGGGADYAEYFEWADGNTDNEDRVGYSVVLDGNKIRKATSSDDAANIIGIVSANPSVVGDSDMDAWKHKYLRDDYGRYIKDTHKVVEWTETVTENEETREVKHDYEDWNIPDGVTVPDDATIMTEDLSGNRLEHRRLNPDYDADKTYVTRENRPEWATVGMMGKLRMRKGQATGDRWIKMRDVSDSVEEWLVR